MHPIFITFFIIFTVSLFSSFHCFFRTIHILHFGMFVGSSYGCKFMFLYIMFSANAHLCVPIFLMFLIWTSPKSTPVCPSYYSYLKNSSHFQDLLFLIMFYHILSIVCLLQILLRVRPRDVCLAGFIVS